MLLVLAATTACGSGQDASDSTVIALERDLSRGPAAPEKVAVQLPKRGAFWVQLSQPGVSVSANEASLVALLEELGRQLKFDVVIGKAFRRRTVTLTASEEPVEVVLKRALAGAPYSLRYKADGAGERTILAAVEVSPPRRSAANTERRLARREDREARRRTRDELSPAEREARREKRFAAEQQQRARQPEYLADLESEDPLHRTRAVTGLLTDEPGNFARVTEVLRNDPDPAVRTAAAEAVFQSDSAASIGELLAALDDPNPEVVLTSIDLLEYVGDETLIPRVDRYADHADPRVRQAVADFKEFMTW